MQATRRPASLQLQQAVERAEAALGLVVSDVDSTTSVRGRGSILRYDDWIAESAQDPHWWVLHGGDDDETERDPVTDDDDDDELWLACEFGGHSFFLDGRQSTAEITAYIADQVQDDVIDEIWGAWPRCPGHQHPMSPLVAGGVAVWRCPSDADGVVPIGRLGAGQVGSS